MLPTLPQSRSSVQYTETPEARDKVALLLMLVQNYLPDYKDEPYIALQHKLDGQETVMRVDYAKVTIANREAYQAHLCIQPKHDGDTLCDACILEFTGIGRSMKEAWEVMAARAKGMIL